MVKTWKKRKVFPILTIFWVLAILILTLTPARHVEQFTWPFAIPYFDKIVHWTMFYAFAYLMLGTFYYRGVNKKMMRTAFLVFGLGFMLGLITEVLQEFVPGRSPEMKDIIANTAGTLSGIGMFLLLNK